MTDPDGEFPTGSDSEPTENDGYHPDVTVSRDDVEMGEATEADFTAPDTDPVVNESVTDLLDRLESETATERQRAVLALSEQDPGEATLATLSALASDDPDALVRQFAVEVLGNLAAPTPEGVLAALEDSDPWVRAEAIVALDHLDQERHAERIAAALEDEHHAVRRNAVISLWKSQGDDALEELLALADDESDRVREWVAELLGRIDHPDAERALADLRNDEESIVAKTAAHALEEVNSTPGPPGGTAPNGTDPTGSRDRPPRL
ncbi:HEAT repeat domain-containing protein [Halorhabdus rudnickae]|uniref:HEAT repeat domain-containing protein n=1 Tax=Halorhabdus rudnickae TaxID=1775544 RepID=UPI001084827C|nr:HEAT repeat domain-containing protein [Halorhabdus rudnickae]